MRLAAKSDSVQASIVKGLREMGLRVEVIGKPVDLLVGVPHIDYPRKFRWFLLEVKTPTKTGKRRIRKDQAEQTKFLEETGTPIVMTVEQALDALRSK